MATDTTETGVSDKVKNSMSDRDNTLNDIAENAKSARALEEAGVDMSNPMEVNLAKEKMARGEDPNPNAGLDPETGEKIVEDPEEVPADESQDEKITVKINGVEKTVLKSEVDAEGGVTAYQKSRSADERMRRNAEERRILDEREEKLRQKELDIAQQEEALSNNNNGDQLSKDAGEPSAEAKVLSEKMYSGDEKKTAEAIDTLLERSKASTPTVDTESIVDQAVAQVQWQNDLRSARQSFETEYSEISTNPEYRYYADQATKRIMQDNPDWTPAQILNEAGEQTKIRFRDELRENQDKADTEKRLERKRATDNVSGIDASPAKKPAQKPKTKSEIVADMQAGRSHAQA